MSEQNFRVSFQTPPPHERKRKRWNEKLKKLEAIEEWYKNFPLIPPYRPHLLDPSPFWHTVYRQKQAFDVAAVHPEDVHVFAFEVDNVNAECEGRGQRKYVITNYLQLWHTVYHLAAHDKHASFYELIPEGSTCKLYFDLEFSKSLNPECNGVEMVQSFIKFVCDELSLIYDISCHVHQVINLDATTDSKFSRHLIFNLPGCVFKDNIQAGNFVHHICHKITCLCQTTSQATVNEDREPDAKRLKQSLHDASTCRIDDLTTHQATMNEDGEPDAKRSKQSLHDASTCRIDDLTKLRQLFVQNRDGKAVLFVDQGVYTRNRNFRLYKCIKHGKANPLVVAADNQYKPRLPKKTNSTQVATERHLFLDSLITNVRYSPNMTVLTMDHDDKWKTSCDVAVMKDEPRAESSSGHLEGFAHSPYPEVDDFILTVINNGGIQGDIRRWVYFTQGQLLIYDIIKNRWCGNINRQHKSNNIMILVDLKKGVYYQKCHDPDCRATGYKSVDVPLPSNLLPIYDFEDEELLTAAIQAEHQASSPVTNTSGDSDEELLAAAVQVEGNIEHRWSGVNNVDDVTTDLTESDEELMAAMVAIEGGDVP
ncbi:DNA-directed primase/polymerase protein-like [Asterias amurensis]|uniref:DNA-directed primase/polymerase protein-like n=1 Tax=Asterias amurensis TaxID=7602 RepID=UPI003AB8AC72